MSIAKKSSSNESQTVFWTPLQSSETFADSSAMVTPQAIRDWLMSFRADSLAPMSPLPTQQGGALMQESEADCGEQWQNAFASFDQDSCSWRTPQHSLFGGWEPFLETWPQWGLMLDGECWALTMSEATISENEFGSLLAEIGNQSSSPTNCQNATVAESHSAKSIRSIIQIVDVSGRITPRTKVSVWMKTGVDLLPTVLATDFNGGTVKPKKSTGKLREDQYRHWCKIHFGLTYPIPMHMEAMMDWPTGWTDLKPLATASVALWRRQHGAFFQDSEEKP